MEQQEKLLNFLESKQALSIDQVNQIKAQFNQDKFNLSSFLIKEKILEEEDLTSLKAELYDLPYTNLIEAEIKDTAINFLPQEIANNYNIVCFERNDKVVKVGLLEPNFKAVEAVNFLAMDEKLTVEYHLISQSSLSKVLKQYQRLEEEVLNVLETRSKDEDEVDFLQNKDINVEEENVESAPVSRIVAVIIRHAVEARASDIHIEPYDHESRVRYRIDGILHTSLNLPKNIHNSIVARIKVLAQLKLDETRIPQDGRIRLVVSKREVDFRVSTLPLINNEKVVMRVLDTMKGPPTLEDLGFNNTCLEMIKGGIKKTSGILLVTGPTGSGKTTTLYSILNILNKEGVNISTLEDPIEYEMKGINQAQVKPKIGFSFASGLRSLLRQDPNIIMVGEIRDEETAELSIHASLTGHLVISTLHTNDAMGAIFRLLDMKIESFLLASTLKTVVAQRLARRLCDNCRQEIPILKEEAAKIVEELSSLEMVVIQKELPELKSLDDIYQWKIFKPVGCSRCEKTGYAGRVAIAESIEIEENLEKMIIERQQEINIEEIKKTQDFISMIQDGDLKILKGLTTREEILRVIET